MVEHIFKCWPAGPGHHKIIARHRSARPECVRYQLHRRQDHVHQRTSLLAGQASTLVTALLQHRETAYRGCCRTSCQPPAAGILYTESDQLSFYRCSGRCICSGYKQLSARKTSAFSIAALGGQAEGGRSGKVRKRTAEDGLRTCTV